MPFMRLQHLTDKTLHEDTLRLVFEERRTTSKILFHLAEIDKRKLYSDHRCSSLFDYCVRLLKLSESSAQRRIIAARFVIEIPDLEKKIADGVISITNLSEANHFFREFGITNTNQKIEILSQIENLTKKECEQKLFQIFKKEKSVKEDKKRISANENLVSMILSDDTLNQLEKLKSLLGRNLSMNDLIQYMAKAAVEKVEKEKFKQTAKPRSMPLAEVKRTPSAAIKREVYKRDLKCVQCGSVHHLNYDHRHAFALGGETKTDNIRMLCFNCNQRARIKVFGDRPP